MRFVEEESPHRLIGLAPGSSRIYTLDQAMKNWTEISPYLSNYLYQINQGVHGPIAPSIEGLFEIFRRFDQTRMFTELGIHNKETRNLGVVIRPEVRGVKSFAIPVRLPQPGERGVYAATFDYAVWGERHDQVMGETEASRLFLSQKDLPLEPYEGLRLVPVGPDYYSEAASIQLSKLYLANMRKWMTVRGPHFFNMPLIQMTSIEDGPRSYVYRRYFLMHRSNTIGYFVCEATPEFYTISHALVDRLWCKEAALSMRDALRVVLHQLRTDVGDRPLLSSRLLNRYITRVPRAVAA